MFFYSVGAQHSTNIGIIIHSTDIDCHTNKKIAIEFGIIGLYMDCITSCAVNAQAIDMTDIPNSL
jgi:hypothetical protein